MKKPALRIIAVLGALATCITVFAACSKDNSQELIYEENGKIYYRKAIGDDAYELVTDANGVTVVDEQGNLLWKVTDAQGNENTHPVSFPAFIDDGKEISCQQFTITVPKGWTNDGFEMIRLRDKDKTTKIDYTFIDADEEGNVPTASQKAEEFRALFKDAIAEGKMTIESFQTQIGGRDAVKLVAETSGEKPSYLEVFMVDSAYGVLSFSCACPYEDGGKVDFKAILDTIEYRV